MFTHIQVTKNINNNYGIIHSSKKQIKNTHKNRKTKRTIYNNLVITLPTYIFDKQTYKHNPYK